jgi:Nitrile hydratase beta subunit
MTATENLLKTLPNDIGGLAADRVERVEHELEPWEKRCHALSDVLDFHKIINTEEKRRGVEALGSELISKLTYYERWIAAFANILFQNRFSRPTRWRGRWTKLRGGILRLRPNKASNMTCEFRAGHFELARDRA